MHRIKLTAILSQKLHPMLLYILTILLLIPLAHAQQEEIAKSIPPINIYVNLHNDNRPVQATAHNTLTSIPITYIQQTTWYNDLRDLKNHSLQQCADIWSALKKICREHTFRILFLTLFSAWAGTSLWCLYTEYRILNNLYWSRFKETVALEHLKHGNQQELGHELLLAIQRRYKPDKHVNDFFTPLMYFFNDLKTEIIILERFLTVHRYIKHFHMERFFPKQEQALHHVQNALARALFLQDLSIEWVAHYKTQLYNAHAQAA